MESQVLAASLDPESYLSSSKVRGSKEEGGKEERKERIPNEIRSREFGASERASGRDLLFFWSRQLFRALLRRRIEHYHALFCNALKALKESDGNVAPICS